LTLTITYLDEHLEAIPTLARWHHAQWASVTPDLTVEDRIAGFGARARRGSVPTAFVALVDGQVAGLASLEAHDLDTHQHLTPWLTSVLVDPRRRGQGIG
jgi:GNAT superfamily N-acetyltransferase